MKVGVGEKNTSDPADHTHLVVLALTATHVAELAAAAAPVLLVLLLGALFGPEAEAVEGFAAHLAVDHLS